MISLIVAVADNKVIGKKGSMLPWRLSGDLARFKEITLGHPIIMGRTTYESIGRPLPGRQNIVITRNIDFTAEGCDIAHSLENAIAMAKGEEIFIIGGANIFEQAMPLVEKIYLTRVHAEPEGDVLFEFDESTWKESTPEEYKADEKNQYDYSFSILKK
jgi:dihydrofolate reductase